MKLHILLAFILFASIATTAQVNKKTTTHSNKIFIDLSSGLDNPYGLVGIGVAVDVHPNVLAGVGIGLSSWGTKLAVKGTYFFKPNYLGGAFSGSLNYSTGLSTNTTDTSSTNPTVTETYRVRGKARVSTNLMYANYRKISKKSRFYLQTGLAFGINNPEITFTNATTNTAKKMDSSVIRAFEILRPGGLIFNVGFLFGLN